MLAITTDYAKSTECPEPYLKAIAEAGFSQVHWCHHWCTDFLYSGSEIDQIDRWLKEHGLKLIDLHTSAGSEKGWLSAKEYERLAGLELVTNRIEMTARLGGDVAIIHVPAEPGAPDERTTFWERLHRSLDELEGPARKHGVRIAIENLGGSNFAVIEQLFSRYGPDYLGLCYDSGHGNMTGDGLDRLKVLGERLISLHLHDNDGEKDEHRLLFSGTTDWTTLAERIAQSSYGKCVSMEVVMANTGIEDGNEFLARAFETGTRFDRMIQECRNDAK